MGNLSPKPAPSRRGWHRPGTAASFALLLSLFTLFLWSFRSRPRAHSITLPEIFQETEQPEIDGNDLWAPSQQEPYLFYDAGSSYHDAQYSCPVAWRWTQNATEAHVVWHNVLDNLPYGPPRPLPRAYPEQKFAFMSLESDKYYPVMNRLSEWGYDFAIDYRIWGTEGGSGGRGGDGPIHIPAVYLTNPTAPGFGLDFRKPPQLPKRRDAVIAAFVSNCDALSTRGALLEALMEALPVHSYGLCSHNAEEPPELPEGDKFRGKEAIASSYKFLFAAENSVSTSYVSEKVYSALAAGTVPVYLGAPDVGRFVPHPAVL